LEFEFALVVYPAWLREMKRNGFAGIVLDQGGGDGAGCMPVLGRLVAGSRCRKSGDRGSSFGGQVTINSLQIWQLGFVEGTEGAGSFLMAGAAAEM